MLARVRAGVYLLPVRHAVLIAANPFVLGLSALVGCAAAEREPSVTTPDLASTYDRQRAPIYAARDADWRCGAIIYQVLVDRFAPPTEAQLDAKRHLYAAPRTLHPWHETPTGGVRLDDPGCFTHEVAFWGGDLTTLRARLGHVHDLGADVLYLNPICQAFTNHKYDAQDYAQISPEYGTRADLKALAADCHQRGMKIMLDGVFNHMGRTSPIFQDAMASPSSRYRDWFYIDPKYKHGYRGWANVPNLPELNLENPAVREHLWEGRDSIVRSYLRDGIDGWRLDVAYDLGFNGLADLTRAAHETKPGSAVIGEIWNYPEEWMPSLDGIMNFHARQILLELLHGKIDGARAGRLLNQMVEDTGLDPILRCWLVLDNHDTARLTHSLKEPDLRRLARVLQFTLPGAPCIYYGSEVEMEGGDDPANRAPMRWDLVTPDNEDLAWFRKIVELRRSSRALRVGDWRLLDSNTLLAFMRRTDRWNETVVVVANATPLPVTEVVSVRDSKLMNYAPLVDALSGKKVTVQTGLITVEVPGHGVMVLRPEDQPGSDYSPYKRVQ